MAARLDTPSTGIPWVDSVIRTFRSDPMAGMGPQGIAGIVGPSARRGLQFVAEQGAERIPIVNRAKLAELLGRSTKIRPMAQPMSELPSPATRVLSEAGSDVNMPQLARKYMEAPDELTHYTNLLNKLFRQRNPVLQNPDQAQMYELLLLELLGGRLP